MTNQEFSDTFTTMLNSYHTQANFGEQASIREIVLNEYEKSVLLTQAQDIVVKSYFDRTLNPQGQGFDDSPRRQVDFSSLIKVATLSEVASSDTHFDTRGIIYQLPRKTDSQNNEIANTTDVLFILNEKLTVEKTTQVSPSVVKTSKEYVIVPISYKEYDRIMSKPYSQPLKKQAWRLFQNQVTGFDVNTELIPKFDIVPTGDGTSLNDVVLYYKIRYVKRPRPIILENLPDGLEIDGETSESSCELNPVLHADILNKAVELTLATRGNMTAQPQDRRRNEE